jgi:hypothetical protein
MTCFRALIGQGGKRLVRGGAQVFGVARAVLPVLPVRRQ